MKRAAGLLRNCSCKPRLVRFMQSESAELALRGCKVLHLDNHVMAIGKPAGMPSCPDGSRDPDALSCSKDFLKQHFNKPGRVFLGLVHRLDRPTSGVMVFARTSKAASRLSKSFRERDTKKVYAALVRGCVSQGGSLEDYIRKEHGRVSVTSSSSEGVGVAQLDYSPIFYCDRHKLTLLRVDLHTGRKHQIRAQLANIGHPIVGDVKSRLFFCFLCASLTHTVNRYGGKLNMWNEDARGVVGEIGLHAHYLAVPHPVSDLFESRRTNNHMYST